MRERGKERKGEIEKTPWNRKRVTETEKREYHDFMDPTGILVIHSTWSSWW